MRKLLMNPEMYNYGVFKKKIAETIEKAKGVVDEKYVAAVRDGVGKMDATIQKLAELRDQKKMLDILAIATPLQNAMRILAHAWMHLWSLTVTIPKLKTIAGDISGEKVVSAVKDNAEAAYYYGRILSARYYLGAEFKHYSGYLDYITSGEQAVVEAFEDIFTGALPQ
jgi:hypothetical protein